MFCCCTSTLSRNTHLFFFYSCLLPTFFNVNSISVVHNRWASDKRKLHPVFQSLFIFDPCKKGFMHRYEHTHPQIYRERTHLLNNLRHTELTPWVFYTNWSPMTIFLGQPCNLHSTFKLDCFILIFIHIFSWLLLIPLKKKNPNHKIPLSSAYVNLFSDR